MLNCSATGNARDKRIANKEVWGTGVERMKHLFPGWGSMA